MKTFFLILLFFNAGLVFSGVPIEALKEASTTEAVRGPIGDASQKTIFTEPLPVEASTESSTEKPPETEAVMQDSTEGLKKNSNNSSVGTILAYAGTACLVGFGAGSVVSLLIEPVGRAAVAAATSCTHQIKTLVVAGSVGVINAVYAYYYDGPVLRPTKDQALCLQLADQHVREVFQKTQVTKIRELGANTRGDIEVGLKTAGQPNSVNQDVHNTQETERKALNRALYSIYELTEDTNNDENGNVVPGTRRISTSKKNAREIGLDVGGVAGSAYILMTVIQKLGGSLPWATVGAIGGLAINNGCGREMGNTGTWRRTWKGVSGAAIGAAAIPSTLDGSLLSSLWNAAGSGLQAISIYVVQTRTVRQHQITEVVHSARCDQCSGRL